ncbi:hypothetical protein [Flavobacterium sp.]|uniref:hypothetical protein n=1 Tax=Flavobacterium sp. TaxID=239 RepID=UPI00286EA70D|nr:hypothetical protein [Flavobacterium sp.]
MKTLKLEFSKNGFIRKAVLLCAFGVATVFTISCSKDDPAPIPPVVLAPLQDPLAGYLAASGFDQKSTNQVNLTDYEFGYSFIPLVNGKMTAIVAKIPDVHAGMRVTVWDKVAGTVLRTETIDITAAGVEVTKAITPLDLVKDKEYFLTFNSNDWYDHRRTDNANVVYPFIVGDLKITSYSFTSGSTQTMPNSPQLSYFAGDCTFKFQK